MVTPRKKQKHEFKTLGAPPSLRGGPPGLMARPAFLSPQDGFPADSGGSVFVGLFPGVPGCSRHSVEVVGGDGPGWRRSQRGGHSLVDDPYRPKDPLSSRQPSFCFRSGHVPRSSRPMPSTQSPTPSSSSYELRGPPCGCSSTRAFGFRRGDESGIRVAGRSDNHRCPPSRSKRRQCSAPSVCSGSWGPG